MYSKERVRKELILRALSAWWDIRYVWDRKEVANGLIEIFLQDGLFTHLEKEEENMAFNIASIPTKKLKKFLKICELLDWVEEDKKN